MEDNEVFPGIDPNRKPAYEYMGGKLYCDGIIVELWQLTEEERSTLIPKEAQEQFLPPATFFCPFDCGSTVTTKISWIHHTRFKHGDFYVKWKDEMNVLPDFQAFKQFVEERKNA